MLIFTLGGLGCHAMRSVTLDELGAAQPARAWVTRPDQTVVVMERPQVFRGKLVGFIDGKYRELAPDDVQRLVVREVARARTAALIAGGSVGVLVAVVLISGRERTFDPCVGGSVDCEPPPP